MNAAPMNQAKEFDLGRARIAFYASKGCGKEPVVNWPGGYNLAEIRKPSPVNPRFQTYVQINGRKLLTL